MGKRRSVRRGKNGIMSAAAANAFTRENLIERMINIAMARFSYSNVPDGINIAYMERKMLLNGSVVLFRIPGLDSYASLSYTSQRKNIYNEPLTVRPVASNGAAMPKLRVGVDCVLGWNNINHTQGIGTIELIADRMVNAVRAMDVNIKWQKTPKLIGIDNPNIKLTVQNILADIGANEDSIIYDNTTGIAKSLNGGDDDVAVTDITVPFVSDKLLQIYLSYWHEFLTFIGVDDVNEAKGDRMVSNEVIGKLGRTENNRNNALIQRQEMCSRFNELFGTDMQVYVNGLVVYDYLLEKQSETQMDHLENRDSRLDGTDREAVE